MPTQATDKSVDKESSVEREPLLDRVIKDYQAWYDYTSLPRMRWDSYWMLYNNQRIKQKYQGTSNTFDPMTHQMVETGVDNVYGSRPKMTFVPTQRNQETDTKLLTGMWDFTWDKNGMDSRIIPFGRETKITGNAALWCSPGKDYMEIRHIPWRDCIFDPNGKDEDSISYGGYRQLIMKDDAKKLMIYDAKKEAWVPRYKGLDEVKTWSESADQTDKSIKDSYSGSTLSGSGRANQIEIITMYYRDKLVEVANRTKVVYEGPNPWQKDSFIVEIPLYEEALVPDDIENTPEALQQFLDDNGLQTGTMPIEVAAIDGFIPVALNRRYVDNAMLIAKGDVEVFADTQEDLNDMRNAKKDNIAYNVKNVAVVDVADVRNMAVKTQLAGANPGDVIEAVGGKNAAGWLDKPDMTTAADNEIAYLKQSIRDSARTSEVIQGVDGAQGKTATEINAQVASASGGFTTEVRNLESGTYKRLGTIFDAYLKIFVTSEQIIRVLGRDGVEWKNYDPSKYWGLYECKPMLETRAQAKKQKQAEDAKNLYLAFKGDPEINQQELKKKVLELGFDMDDDDVKLLLVNPSANNQATMGGLPAGDVASGTAPGMPPMAPPMQVPNAA